jgi:hypothetical protein
MRFLYYPSFQGWPRANSLCIYNTMRAYSIGNMWGIQRLKGNAVRWLTQTIKALEAFIQTLHPQEMASWAEQSDIHRCTYDAIKCIFSQPDLKAVQPACELLVNLVVLLEESVYKRCDALQRPAWQTEAHWAGRMAYHRERRVVNRERAMARAASKTAASPARASASAYASDDTERGWDSDTLEPQSGTPSPSSSPPSSTSLESRFCERPVANFNVRHDHVKQVESESQSQHQPHQPPAIACGAWPLL